MKNIFLLIALVLSATLFVNADFFPDGTSSATYVDNGTGIDVTVSIGWASYTGEWGDGFVVTIDGVDYCVEGGTTGAWGDPGCAFFGVGPSDFGDFPTSPTIVTITIPYPAGWSPGDPIDILIDGYGDAFGDDPTGANSSYTDDATQAVEFVPPPPPALSIEDAFCDNGGGIPYNVTNCEGFIVVENGGPDIIYVLSIYYDPASPTPYQAPAGTTFIDVFDAYDNYQLYDGAFYDCDLFLNAPYFPTELTTTAGVFYEPIVDLTAITAVCDPVTVSIFAIPFDRTLFTQPAGIDAIEMPVTIYPTGLTTNIVDDGSTCGTPTVELVAADGSVCETETGGYCQNEGDTYTTDFAATATGATLAGAPAACGLPADVTVTCSSCDVLVPTLSQWGLMTLALLLMTFGALKIGHTSLQTSRQKN